LAIGVALLLPWFVLLFLRSPWLSRAPIWWGLYLLKLALLLLLPLWLARRRLGQWLPVRLPIRRFLFELAVAVPVTLGIVAFLLTATFVWTSVSGDRTVQRVAWETAFAIGGLQAMLILACVSCTLVPVVEEVFFRGFLYNALRRTYRTSLAAALQAFLFAVMHPYGIGMLLVFVIGLMLASVYDWRKTLVAPVLAHALVNLVVAVYLVGVLIALNTPIFGISGDDGQGQIVVTGVRPNQSAERAGIRRGDVVVSFDGTRVDNLDVLREHVQSKTAGQRVAVVVRRDGKPMTIEVVLYGRFHKERAER